MAGDEVRGDTGQATGWGGGRLQTLGTGTVLVGVQWEADAVLHR